MILSNDSKHWRQGNFAALHAEIAQIKSVLHSHLPAQAGHVRALHQEQAHAVNASQSESEMRYKPKAVDELNVDQLATSSDKTAIMLDNLCQLLGLSPFDRQLLLLCLGTELDPEISALCSKLTQRPYPSLNLALLCFEGHCSALSPEAPLVYFQLIDVDRSYGAYTQSALVITPWVLFYLTGRPSLPQMLSSSMQRVQPVQPILSNDANLAQQIVLNRERQNSLPGYIQFVTDDSEQAEQIAALVAEGEKRELYRWNLHHLPTREDEQDSYLRILEREVIGRQCLLLIDCQRLNRQIKEPEYLVSYGLQRLLRDIPMSCLLHADAPFSLAHSNIQFQYLSAPSAAEQQQIWQHCLPDTKSPALQSVLNELPAQYHLSRRQINHIAQRVDGESSPDRLKAQLWQHSREHLRQDLAGLAQLIPPSSKGWDDLILADQEKQSLQAMASQARLRYQVFQQWGFAGQASYGMGIAALFAGSSGTGKTLAARIIASSLNLDLYQVDLSSIADKYIGETEKKLDRIFQAAEKSGAVLLFDEADALFGKRTQVQDARDRYANMSVSFLLQRMENYQGLSILTTNQRAAIDSAFTRRLGFIVQFPFPAAPERQQIWRATIPQQAPTENIDYQKLARLGLAGGAIRNVVLQAAFIAAERRQPITMSLLREATAQEFIKVEKTLDQNLVADW